MTHPKTPLALGAGALLLTACATALEPDGRLDQTRADLAEAREAGARAPELSSAEGYIADAATALQAGDADAYDSALSLADAYVDLGLARGALDIAEADLAALTTERDTLAGEAETCKADLAAVRDDLADAEVAILAATLGASRIETTDDGDTLVLQTVTFASGSAALTAEATERLGALVGYLTDNETVTAEIAGHTDSAGAEASNQALSEARAKAVADLVIAGGVDAARITSSGFGESDPIADNATAAGRAENRRVEVTLKR